MSTKLFSRRWVFLSGCWGQKGVRNSLPSSEAGHCLGHESSFLFNPWLHNIWPLSIHFTSTLKYQFGSWRGNWEAYYTILCTLIENDRSPGWLESSEGLFLAIDVFTTCVEAISRLSVLISKSFFMEVCSQDSVNCSLIFFNSLQLFLILWSSLMWLIFIYW